MPAGLDAEISNILYQLTCKVDKKSYQTELKNALLKEKAVCADEADYMRRIIEKIAYLSESKKTIFELVHQVFGNIYYSLAPSQIETILNEAQWNIRNHISELTKTYSALMNSSLSTQKNIAMLEMNYAITQFSHELANDLLESICHPHNKSYYAALYTYPPFELLMQLRSRIDFYSASFMTD